MNISMLRIVYLSELLLRQFYNIAVISLNWVSTVIGRSDRDAAHKFWLICQSLIKLMQWKLMIQTNTGTPDKTFLSSLSTVTENQQQNINIILHFYFGFEANIITCLYDICLINSKVYTVQSPFILSWGVYIAYWRLQYLLLIVEWEFVVHK